MNRTVIEIKLHFKRKGDAINYWIDSGNYGGRILTRFITEIHRINYQDIHPKKIKQMPWTYFRMLL